LVKIIIVGAGNMGSIFAARLIDAGHDVSVVARNKRLRELQENGLRLRHQYSQKIERYTPKVFAELTPEIAADLILVMVQRPQVDALIPAIAKHPCARICFMFNCSEINPQWQAAIGNRLVWGFPAALGGTKDGIVVYLVLPGWLRLLQITTVGVAGTGDPNIAREIVNVLRKAKIASVFHLDMPGWLMTHTGLMLPGMVIGENKLQAAKKQSLTFTEARQMAQAQKECFAVVRASGLQVSPLNIYLLSLVPGFLILPIVWLLSRSPSYSRAVLDHVDHAHAEMQTMYAGIKANAASSGTKTPVLDVLCVTLKDTGAATVS
jgi:2-dehydropantoate 2-reductase